MDDQEISSGMPIPIEIRPLLERPGLADLGPGPRSGVWSEGEVTRAVAALDLPPERHDLVRAVLLLWNDQHDAAHATVQELENADASLVHAILHRREPDYGNATYWFRRVGLHPAYRSLAAAAAGVVPGSLVTTVLPAGRWDACGFVAACEEAMRPGTDLAIRSALQRVQALETEALLSLLLSL